MSKFTNFDPKTTLVPIPYAKEILGKEHWVVTKGFEFYVGQKQEDHFVYIPNGYLTDGATVPSFLKRLVPTWGTYGAATIVHDYLCEHLEVVVKGQRVKITRAESDRIFLEAMEVLGVPKWRRYPMYIAVRLYSKLVAKDKPTPWRDKFELEIKLRLHYQQYENYDFPKET